MSVELAARAAAALEGAEARDVVRWAVATFGRRLAVAASMQDAVLPHLVSRELPDVDVLFLDTGYHFEETLRTRDRVARALPLTVVDVTPRQSVAEQDTEYGPRLHDRDPDLCCFLRKVDPLARALDGAYDAWVTGVRRDEAPSRAATPVVAWDDTNGVVKVNPLVTWSLDDVHAYEEEHALPVNPLTRSGYPSIGCAPCTRRVAPGEDPRSGRWAGTAKTECGLHA
ncbi:MAG: phosphoadenylyl-sulfate reductase [Actinomycetota bacterium]